MIVRLWHGKVPSVKANDYHQHLLKTGLVIIHHRRQPKRIIIKKRRTRFYALLYVTYWDDIEAIKRLAGENYEKAQYYPRDKDYLLEFEPLVTHYEVLEYKLPV